MSFFTNNRFKRNQTIRNFTGGLKGPLFVWSPSPISRSIAATPAIFACVVFSVADFLFRRVNKHTIISLYWFTLVVSLVFGAIDLYATNPFIFKYESVATSLLMGVYFGLTLFRGKPLVQQLAEKTMSPEKAPGLYSVSVDSSV